MLGFIPTLYPDELLYSFIARYHAYSLNLSTKHTANELFRDKRKLATPDLPTNLNSLQECMKVFSNLETEELVGQHTFYYFYTNFLGIEKKTFVKKSIYTGENKGAIHMKTGIMASGIKEKTHFYYCPDCASNEIQQLGENYWHLSHQLPGVLICTEHRVLLMKSNIEFRSKKRYEFQTAFRATNRANRISCDEQSNLHLLYLIAKECIKLATKDYNFELSKVQKEYKVLLLKFGYIKGRGTVDQQRLAEDFNAFYGKETLSKLLSNVTYDSPSCWLKSITRKHRKAFHPIHHILLILFLKESLDSIEKMKLKDVLPFGEGPYPCLNRGAEHYKRLIVNDIEIKVCNRIKQPIGVFKCNCGYHYSRRGPDVNGVNQYEAERIVQYGKIWLEKVNELVHTQNYSFRSVARQLSVDTKTIIKYSQKKTITTHNKEKLHNEIQLKKREWQTLIRENPDSSVTELRKINPAIYAWLYRNSREWLKTNSPKGVKKIQSRYRVDWELRDLKLVKEVEAVAGELIKREPPVRVTVSLIGTEIGKRSILQQHLRLLPLTDSTLKQLIEDVPSFQIRRVHYIVDQLKIQNQKVTGWFVRKKAGLKKDLDTEVERVLKKLTE